jgi:nucleoside-diphosphate-sugar epimerase
MPVSLLGGTRMNAVVTGASGFVGRAMAARLADTQVLALGSADWRANVARTDFAGAHVWHLAARVHGRDAPWPRWHADNVEKTEALARAAAGGGARRFVFASTLKVHGEESGPHPFHSDDPLRPEGPYARSKAMAEERLAVVARETGLDLVIVRAPLVFGRGAGANLDSAARLARSGLPLPFASIENRRSWIHVDDLCALLAACGEHPAAAGHAFIASHPDSFSTPRLFRELRARLAREPRLFGAPAYALEAAAALVGRGPALRPLTRSLEGDSNDAMQHLGWRPAVSFEDAVADLVGPPKP